MTVAPRMNTRIGPSNLPMEPEDTDEVKPRAEDLATIEPPRRRGWILGVGIGAVVAAAVAAWALSGSDADPYQTASVERGTLEQWVTAVGQLEPRDSVEIGSDLTGKVLEVLVEENDTVTAGQVLARLDPTTFESAVAQARAQVQSAAASVGQAKVELAWAESERDRTTRLYEKGAATRNAVDEAEQAVLAARASLAVSRASQAQARASLERAELDLEHTVITSPIDGVVLSRMVDPGQTVVSSMSATSLFDVASDLARLEAEVEVDEADVARVAAGQPARFTVSAWPDRTFDATVQTVDLAPIDSESVITYGALLSVDNGDGALRSGMTVTANLLVGTVEDALIVPTTALRYRPEERAPIEGDHVWVDDGGTARAIAVEPVASDGTRTAVVGAELTEDARVIVGGGS